MIQKIGEVRILPQNKCYIYAEICVCPNSAILYNILISAITAIPPIPSVFVTASGKV